MGLATGGNGQSLEYGLPNLSKLLIDFEGNCRSIHCIRLCPLCPVSTNVEGGAGGLKP